ncbi:MAG: type I-U CRISPR-associated protein Csx17 [Gemmatimonadetes bacterium]|nr:type I-U CRISPR-associated protein Csx17 [Gemmatimonadota bacterium]
MRDRLTLQGCPPTPLASYLKALGVLRLLSSGTNSVTGAAADPDVRGMWEGERFHLQTSLGRNDLLRYFLHDYAPSPVIAPWNGGSGFYPEDNRDGFTPLNSPDVAARFGPFREAILSAVDALEHFGLPLAIPEGETKDARKKRRAAQVKQREAVKQPLVAALRARLPHTALPWLDSALVLSGGGLGFPPLLGTGGNDGRLDFTNNLMRRLASEAKPPGLFNAASGAPSPASEGFLDNALFGSPIHELTGVAVGQFSPGVAGGPNATTGYEGDPTVNPWDYVFMLEGAATFASAATRRHQSNATARASFPFTVGASGAGWGGVESTDESDARAEFWAPLWTRPALFTEVSALFSEGRAVTNGRTASDGLGFARALATLGVNRGFSEFQRFGIFKRAGKNHYAAALGRRRAAPSPGAELVADLDQGGWLRQVRRFGRNDNQPAAMRNAVKSLEDSLFALLAPECSHTSVRVALEAIGWLGTWLSNSPKGRDVVAPPPLLSRAWLLRADDGSPEYRIAAALAGIGIPPPYDAERSDSAASRPQSWGIPPMAAHFAPLTNGPGDGFEGRTFFWGRRLLRRRSWAADNSPPTVVWGHGGLIRNMIAVLDRRIVEASIRGLEDKPFGGASFARLPDVGTFLTGKFDDRRCSALLAGMVWAQPVRLPATELDTRPAPATLPFAYAALKPILSPNDALVRVGAIPPQGSIPIPPDLLGPLRAGGRSRDGREIAGAVRSAFSRARSSGLISPYDPIQSGSGLAALRSSRIGVGVRPDRLAAAMLIPVSDHGLASLLRRAYSGTIPDNATHSSEEAPNVS